MGAGGGVMPIKAQISPIKLIFNQFNFIWFSFSFCFNFSFYVSVTSFQYLRFMVGADTQFQVYKFPVKVLSIQNRKCKFRTWAVQDISDPLLL